MRLRWVPTRASLRHLFGSVRPEMQEEKFVYLCEKDKKGTYNKVDKAAKILLNDGLIALPTDTIYGIAGCTQNNEAINRIYNIKGRLASKPLAISVADVSDIYRWGKVNVPMQLLTDLLPGAVTVVFERTPELNPCLNPGNRLVGIRVPDHCFVRQLAKTMNKPLTLTSANISSEESPLSVHEFKNIWPHLDMIIDGGVLGNTAEARQGSTVVDLSIQGKYRIIRDGSAYQPTVDTLQRKYSLQPIRELNYTG